MSGESHTRTWLQTPSPCLSKLIVQSKDLKLNEALLYFKILRFSANSYLCMKMTPSKSSGKSSSELIVLAPDSSEFQRKY